MSQAPATRVEVSIAALKHNIAQFQSLLRAPTKILAIIKSNAYGHGLEIGPTIEPLVGGFGVISLDEALRLRELGVKKRIVVLGPTTNPHAWQLAQTKDVEMCVFDNAFTSHLSVNLPALKVHIKVNTGLNRLGIIGDKLKQLCNDLDMPQVEIKAIFSHLADAENPSSVQTKEQLKAFQNLITSHTAQTIQLEKHIAATAATLLFPESHHDWVRIGIGLYGIWPSPETLESWQELHPQSNFALKPALKYISQIMAIQEVPAGSLIGYGGTYRTRKKSRIATIPIGYYEGIPRQLSNKGIVKIHNVIAPIVGNICMNMTMIDITHIPDAQLNDDVIFIDNNQESPNSAQRQGELCGTIAYTMVTNIPQHIPRILQN